MDWDGEVSSVLFLPNCNFRCPYCQNAALVLHPETEETIPFERVEDHLRRHREWIDGVCITGGEPTLHSDLPNLCSRLKDMGFLIKLDTNGTNPNMVKALVERGLVDYVALDIKAPLTVKKYSEATATDAEELLPRIQETMEILLESDVDYEFRTTVIPTIHEKKDIQRICSSIKGCRKYVIQNFRGENTLDPVFSEVKPFTDKDMRSFLTVAQNSLSNVKLR